jgi:predicted alpha-1,2-mannosidase
VHGPTAQSGPVLDVPVRRARLLGLNGQAAAFAERGDWWRNVFNSQATDGAGTSGYIQARNLDGSWVTPFNPGSDRGFAQGTSATYTWMVPQDVQGLAEAMGGREVAVRRLDGFFHKPDGSWSVRGGDPLRYDPTNEPGIHAPWLYNALGQPWKTQATVRQILNTVYGTGPAGRPGNDDLGTMSAWYVFSALGLYPQTPGSASMLLGAPLFPHAVVDRPGRDIVIEAPAADADADHPYVSGVRLNRRPYDRSWTDARFLQGGGTLTFRLGEQPDTDWATSPGGLPR